jgi:hypothetical protein
VAEFLRFHSLHWEIDRFAFCWMIGFGTLDTLMKFGFGTVNDMALGNAKHNWLLRINLLKLIALLDLLAVLVSLM